MLDSSRLGGGARRLAALSALVALTGCGPIAAGILLGTSSSSGSGTAPNTPPSVTIGAVASAASGAIEVPVVVKDAESHPVNLVVEVSIGGGAFAPASLVAGATAPMALATSPAGTAYTFKWDSKKDVGPRDARGVQVRVTPYDASQGNAATATLDVLDNEPPVAAILTLSWDSTTGTGFIFYSLSDSAADKSSVKVEYSLDGGAAYKPATRATSARGDATTGLDASVSGSVHTFAWDSRTDAPGVRNGNVFFRVTPSDALAGAPVALGGMAIDNSVPPQITNASGAVSGNVVTVTYTIVDVVNDPVTVGVAFSADGGAYAPATGVVALLPDTSLSGQASSGAGVVHQLSWNATQAGLGNHVVTLQLTPTSTVTGAPAATPPLPVSVSGNGPPSGTLAVVPRQDGGSTTTPLTLTAQDPQGSNVSVVGSFSVNGGPVFAASFTGQTTGLSTAVVSSVHVLNWNAQTDLAARGYAGPVTQNVVLALTLNNGVQSGLPVQTNGFTYGNAPPSVAIGALPPSASGVVALPFTLTDGTSDAATVTIDWRPSGSPEANGSYKTINVSVGSVTSLTTSPAGVVHSVGWNTLDTTGGGGVGLTNPSVVVRFKATDGLWNGVSPVQTTSLAISNNQPPIATVQAIQRQGAGALTQIPFTLYNAEGTNNLPSDLDPITITVEYSLNGGPFATATGVSSTGPFSANPGGVAPPPITWNAAGDLGAATVSSNVVVRITPSDTYQTGASGVSAAFTVGDAAPVVSFDTVLSPQSGQVTFDFALSDSTADVCNVDFSFTINGTTTISSTTAVKPTLSPPGNAIASGYPGTATRQSMVWNAPADFAALGRTIANDSIVATVLISDSWGAPAVTTTPPAFTLKSGVGAPSGTIAPVSRVAGTSTATFSLTAQDPQGLSVGLSGTFSVNGGTAYPATFQPPTTNVSTAPASNPHAVVWNAQSDLAAHGYVAAVVSNVVVTLVLDNGAAASLPIATNAFIFGNTPPAIAPASVAAVASSGVVPLHFSISDSTQDVSRVTVEFKIDGTPDTTYQPIAIAVGSVTSLATGATPPGTAYAVGWDTTATTGGIGATDRAVWVRFTPDDGLPGGGGAAALLGPFAIQNNEAPVALMGEPASNLDARGAIRCGFYVRDVEQDAADVLVQWSTNPTAFPIVDDLTDPAARRAALLDPGIRGARGLVTPHLRKLLDARARVTTLPPDTIELCEIEGVVAIQSSAFLGHRLDLLGPEGGVLQTRRIAAVDPLLRRLRVDSVFSPGPTQGQRCRVREAAEQLLLGVPTAPTTPGAFHSLAWDVEADTGVRSLATSYYLRVTPFQGTRVGFASTSQVAKAIDTDQFEAKPAVGTSYQIAGSLTIGATSDPVLGDFNNDGAVDLVLFVQRGDPFGNVYASPVLFQGNGVGGFNGTVSTSGPTGGTVPQFVVAADVNEDGALDLIADQRIYLGSGAGAFNFSVAFNPSKSPVVLDVNGDGHLDIVSGAWAPNNFGLSIALGSGTGTFPIIASAGGSTPPNVNFIQLRVASLRGSGQFDAVTLVGANNAAGQIDACLSLTSGSMSSFSATVGVNPLGLAVGDLDGDGIPDVLVLDGLDGAQGLTRFRGVGNGTFTAWGRVSLPAPSGATGIDLTDVNGDGNPDVVVHGTTASRVLICDGKGNFSQAGASLGLARIATGDVDGDGNPDLVGTTANGYSTVLLRGTVPTLPSALTPIFLPSGTPRLVPPGDLNGDGLADVLLIETFPAAGSQITPFLSDGGGRLTAAPVLNLGVYDAQYLKLADLDGDGNLDIVWSSPGTVPSGYAVAFGNGDATFRTGVVPVISIGGSYAPYDFFLADVNEDGILDLIGAGDNNLNPAFKLLGLGGGRFGTVSALGVRCLMGLYDTNRDGHLDAVAPSGGSTTLTVSFGVGNGTFPTSASSASQAYGPIADLDGDGRLDCLVLNGGPGNSYVSLGQPSGAFGGSLTGRFEPSSCTATASESLSDLDLDERLDVVAPTLARGQGDATFSFWATLGPSVLRAVAVDLDGDGCPDLVSLESGPLSIKTYLSPSDRPSALVLAGDLRPASPSTGTGVGSDLALAARARAYLVNTDTGTIDGTVSPALQGATLQFRNVTIASGATVKVVGSHPLVLLATGTVQIAGLLDASGAPGAPGGGIVANAGGAGGRGGPGGGGGGAGGGWLSGSQFQNGLAGLGLGRGDSAIVGGNAGGGGHRTAGGSGSTGPSPTYGDDRISVLLGGSGGGGGAVGGQNYVYLSSSDTGGGGGGGGGGAARITASGAITITGSLLADGGAGALGAKSQGGHGGGGSGGAILLQSRTSISVTGLVAARGGTGASGGTGLAGGAGGEGRVRLETPTGTATLGAGSILPASQAANLGTLP